MRSTFDQHRVTWGPYRSVRQALAEDADLSAANPMFGWLDAPGIGRHLAPTTPLHFSKFERGAPVRAPLLGEHTDTILQSLLGLSQMEIQALHSAGIVAGPQTQ